MIKSLLKTLAISFGGGLALGAGLKLGQGSAKERAGAEVDLNPLLDRLDDVEDRIIKVESSVSSRPAGGAPPVSDETAPEARVTDAGSMESVLADQSARLASHAREMTGLRHEMQAVDLRRADQMAELGRKVEHLELRLPQIVEVNVGLRFDEIEQKLQKNFEEAQSRSMDSFVQAIQTRVVQRISTLETSLVEQSQAIGKLCEASSKTDENLQKMLAGIEKLCDQSRPPPPPQTMSWTETLAQSVAAPRPAAAPSRPNQGSPEQANPDSAKVNAPAPARSEKPPSQEARSVPLATEPRPASHSIEPPPPPLSEQQNRPETIAFKLLAPEPKARKKWGLPVILGVLIAVAGGVAGLRYSGGFQEKLDTSPAPSASAAPSASNLQSLQERLSAKPNDESALLDLSREYVSRKDWPRAEENFRGVLRINPKNREAVLGLSDVLYQEQKYEESAAVLNRLSAGSSP